MFSTSRVSRNISAGVAVLQDTHVVLFELHRVLSLRPLPLIKHLDEMALEAGDAARRLPASHWPIWHLSKVPDTRDALRICSALLPWAGPTAGYAHRLPSVFFEVFAGTRCKHDLSLIHI